MMSEKPEDIVITDACEVVAEFVQGDACQSPEGTADLPTSVNPVVAELSEEPAPIPPPRKESQFKDAITALQRAKSARAEPDTTGLRQGRDLTDEERRAVAEKRARWQQTGSIHAGNHEADSLSATRRDRDLNEEEKKRIAATRCADRSPVQGDHFSLICLKYVCVCAELAGAIPSVGRWRRELTSLSCAVSSLFSIFVKVVITL